MGIRDRIIKALSIPAGATTMTEAQVMAQSTQQGALATPLERNPENFVVPFAPGNPLFPSLINPPREDGRADPRRYQFPVAWNLQLTEQRFVPFSTLRAVAEQVDIVRKCIEAYKSAMVGMDWGVNLSPDAVRRVMAEQNVGQVQASKIARDSLQDEITRAMDFWRMPDRINGLNFQEWFMLLLEEVLVIDALTIYPNRSVDENLHSLEILDGTTIKPLLSARGSRPLPPHPAYQQIIWGYPRGEFTASADSDGEFTADDLVYSPRWRRTDTPYGHSPVERSLPLADLYMKRLQWLRTEFTDGVSPEVMLKTDASFGNNPELLKGYERVFNDALAGNMEERRRMKMLPAGVDPIFPPGADSKYRSEFDEWLVKNICTHFGLLPSQIGITPDTGLGGKGHQEGEASTTETIGIRPMVTWVSDLLSQLSYRFLGMPKDLVFTLSDGTEDDEMAQATRRQLEFFSGQRPLNEIRSEMGQPLYSFPEADQPLIISGSTIVPVAAAFEALGMSGDLVDDPTTSEVEAEQEAVKNAELDAFIRWTKTPKKRDFVFKAIDADKGSELNGLAQHDPEAARDLAFHLRKAGGVRPKVRGGREPFPAQHPARKASDKLVTLYTERWRSVGQIDAEKLADRFFDAQPADPHGWVTQQNLNLYGNRGRDFLRDLWLEAGWMGYAAAKVAVRAARKRDKSLALNATDWDGWTPGNPDIAGRLLNSPGLAGMMDRAGVELRGIERTTLDRIGSVLGTTFAEGGSARDAARGIREVIGDKARAEMIAATEMNRASSVAAMDSYRDAGVSEVEWLTAGDDGVCEECAENEANSPYAIGDAPEPPAHPNCGCQLLPVAFDNEDVFEFSPEDEAGFDGMDHGDDPVVEPLEPEAHSDIAPEPELVAEGDITLDREWDGKWRQGQWSRVDIEAMKQEAIAAQEARWARRGGNVNEATRKYYLDKIEKDFKKIKGEYRNGELTVQDRYGLKPAQIEQALRDIDLARSVRDLPADTKVQLVNNREFKTLLRDDPTGVGGFCEMAQPMNNGFPTVTLRGEYYKTQLSISEQMRADIKELVDKKFGNTRSAGVRENMVDVSHAKWFESQKANPHLSSSVNDSMATHTTIHELGHATDRFKMDSASQEIGKSLFDRWKDEMPSEYAREKPVEAYAECFTQWTRSGGTSPNPAVQAYAQAYGWRKP